MQNGLTSRIDLLTTNFKEMNKFQSFFAGLVIVIYFPDIAYTMLLQSQRQLITEGL